MVYAFLVHTLSTGPCQILFSQFFGPELLTFIAMGCLLTSIVLVGNCQHERNCCFNSGTAPKEIRDKRKDQLQLTAMRVQSEYAFRKSASNHAEIEEDTASSESRALPMMRIEAGVFRLPEGKPFPVEKHIIWEGFGNCGFTMVLSPVENKSLAENVLSLIVRYLLQLFKQGEQLEEILMYPEKVASVLHVFLPVGQLLFMNHRVIKQLEKELDQMLTEKK